MLIDAELGSWVELTKPLLQARLPSFLWCFPDAISFRAPLKQRAWWSLFHFIFLTLSLRLKKAVTGHNGNPFPGAGPASEFLLWERSGLWGAWSPSENKATFLTLTILAKLDKSLINYKCILWNFLHCSGLVLPSVRNIHLIPKPVQLFLFQGTSSLSL